jgi:hypothetical protein
MRFFAIAQHKLRNLIENLIEIATLACWLARDDREERLLCPPAFAGVLAMTTETRNDRKKKNENI